MSLELTDGNGPIESDGQDTFQISLALVPDGHSVHLIGTSLSLIFSPL